ncbi:hypothetical protein H6P81_018033 [Aristolochia fimbriata]|uniref:Uncharacterized protein n=1 Tax=Aristolochia fimbriata TaxID=158543 RepID=A0AAV7E1Q5_ARIFI|nr:hypothetical protein H6P81_018033 [Aristolochia fimbriata]
MSSSTEAAEKGGVRFALSERSVRLRRQGRESQRRRIPPRPRLRRRQSLLRVGKGADAQWPEAVAKWVVAKCEQGEESFKKAIKDGIERFSPSLPCSCLPVTALHLLLPFNTEIRPEEGRGDAERAGATEEGPKKMEQLPTSVRSRCTPGEFVRSLKELNFKEVHLELIRRRRIRLVTHLSV